MQFTSETVQRYVRIALQYLAAALVTRGVVSPSATWIEPAIGLGVGIATFLWTVYGNRVNALLAQAAKVPNTTIITDKAAAEAIPAANVVSNTDNKVVAKIAAVALTLLFAAAALVPSSVYAQSTRAATRPTLKLPTLPTLTGNPIQDFNTNVKNAVTSPNNPITQLLKDFSTIIGNDITGAQALSVQIPDLQDGNGYACWTEAVKFKEVIDAHPIPLTFQAATDFEGLRLAIMAADRLCNNSACTVIFSDGANLANQLANAAGGALTIPLPSLSALCSKVPSFAIVAPPSAATPVTPAAISNATKAVTAPAATPLTAQ